MNVLVTGGCGYIGSVLVLKLLKDGHQVTSIDAEWFGNFLSPHPHLASFKRDIRDPFSMNFLPDAVIHLAAVANDPTGDLNPKLTWEINALATMRLAETAARSGVKQFIYASSGSVYGVSDAPEVTEEAALDPLSEYNKTKMVAERCVLSYADRMAVQIIRPATVCGYSPRTRLDVVVNMLTMQALKGKITVLGGKQMRPNIHIQDMADLYLWMLERPKLTGIWNAGFENLSVMQIARKIESYVNCAILEKPSNDPRSYRMNSDKLLAAGFKPKHSVDGAIGDLIEAYATGHLKDEDNCYNLRVMPR